MILIWIIMEALVLAYTIFGTSLIDDLKDKREAERPRGEKVGEGPEYQAKNFLFDFDKDLKNRLISIIFLSFLAACSALQVSSWASNIESVKLLILFVGSSLAMLTDVKANIIPNPLICALLLARFFLLLAESLINPETIRDVIIMNVLGGGSTFIILASFSALAKGGLGMGDVKLFSIFGLFTGLSTVLFLMVYALGLASAYSLIMIILKKMTLKGKLPFAPFIFFGFVLALFFKTL